MKLYSLFENDEDKFGYKFDGFDKTYSQKKYWSEFEKKFYGTLPEHPLVQHTPTNPPSDEVWRYYMDRRSEIHCAFNCPHGGLKPIMAIEDVNNFPVVYIIINDEAVLLDEIITNRKDNFVVWEHARNVFSCINNKGAAGYRNHVRQRATFIMNDQYQAYKAVLYSIKGTVKKILEKYGINF